MRAPAFAAAEVPSGVQQRRTLGAGWGAWLDGLPRRVGDLLDEWSLARDGDEVWHGFCSVVLPVRTPDGDDAALKVGFTDDESEHEHLALQHWHGRGAVRLLRADPRRGALLLERLSRRDLTGEDDVDACAVVAGLYGRLHVPAVARLRPLSASVGRWTDDLAALPRDAPVPRRLVEQAVSLGRSFVADPATDGVLVHTDLHYGNVLAADRGPWLAIDPKPVSGDPHYEPAPLLWNRWSELAGDVRGSLRRRFHALVDIAGLDEDRARDWVVVRMLHNALWRLADDPGVRRVTPTDEWLTMCVAVAKAVQD